MNYIAVIITVHNRKEKTLACLGRLYQQKIPEGFQLEVFLTDDGSSDGTSEAILQFFPRTHIIKGDGSLFWNRGMYVAWNEAAKMNPNFYLWLNDDTVIKDGCISVLLDASLKKGHLAIMVGSTVKSPDSNELTYGGRTIKNRMLIEPSSNGDILPCEIFNGNIVLIPRKVFLSVGYNDSFYRHSFGDFDYGISAKKRGFSSYIAPGILGFCSRNNPVPLFQRNCYSLRRRFQLLYSPLGMNPLEDFHYQRKIHNIIFCILHFLKLHINVFFVKDCTICK